MADHEYEPGPFDVCKRCGAAKDDHDNPPCPHCGERHQRRKATEAELKEIHNVAKRITLDLVEAYNPPDAMLIVATVAAALTVNTGSKTGLARRATRFMDAYVDLLTILPTKQ